MWMNIDRIVRLAPAAFGLLVLVVTACPQAFAQAPQQAPAAQGQSDQGYVRIQGRDRDVGGPAPAIGGEVLLNLREEMRKFVQSISTYARRTKPNFIIIVQDVYICNNISLMIGAGGGFGWLCPFGSSLAVF